MTTNMGTIDRVVRLVLGIVLLGAPFVSGISALQSGTGMVVSIILGLVMLATSTLKFCPLYRIVGIRTCKT